MTEKNKTTTQKSIKNSVKGKNKKHAPKKLNFFSPPPSLSLALSPHLSLNLTR